MKNDMVKIAKAWENDEVIGHDVYTQFGRRVRLFIKKDRVENGMVERSLIDYLFSRKLGKELPFGTYINYYSFFEM